MRNCVEVITKMILLIPEDKVELIEALEWNKEDASYKAPEETLQWLRTSETLQKFITKPTEDWEFEVLSEFTTKSIQELKIN